MNKLAFTLLILPVMFFSCRTAKCLPERITEYRDSVVVRTKTDSVFFHIKDSVYVEKNDSERLVVKYKYLYRDKIIERLDTVYIDNTKTETVVKTERYIPLFFKICTFAFITLLTTFLIRYGIKILRLYYGFGK